MQASDQRSRIVERLRKYVDEPGRILDRVVRFRSIQASDICWIFGVGRSGSTWLTELLDGLYATRVWHEPCFGTMLSYPEGVPAEMERTDCFFSRQYEQIWKGGLRDMLLRSVRARFGRIANGTKIIVKDINSPQLCPHFASIFPESRYILLVRDPFDVLDSHIDMTQPGAWNEHEASEHTAEAFATRIRYSLEHSLDGYDHVRSDLRLLVRYRDLLRDPEGELSRCARFLGISATRVEIEQTVALHRFERHECTGRGEFRRFGRSGVWHESDHFSPEVLEVAQRQLGALRSALGYDGDPGPASR